MNTETYTYETKCRRCGSLQEWHFSNKDQITSTQFASAMTDYIQYPRMRQCDTCGKSTVQDVVSFTDARS